MPYSNMRKLFFSDPVCIQLMTITFTTLHSSELGINMAHLPKTSLSLDAHDIKLYFQMETNMGIFWNRENTIFTKSVFIML